MEPGQIVADRYRVDSVLGRGGMGIVVSATHVLLDQPVAIKFLKPDVCGNATAIARILREARTVSHMETEHVARVLDCGVVDDSPFLVMELLHGRSLARELALRGSMPYREVCDYLVQACDALGEAHALGIVHRDLKPGNLFLARRRGGISQIKVLDFGLSKLLLAPASGGELSLTDAHSLLGTPLYVSPEQLRSSKEVDARTDIWSLGLILYQLITGYTPFYARSIPQLFAQIAREPTQPVRELRPEVPAELDAVVQRCLAKSPDDRFANAADLGLALAEHCPVLPVELDRLRSFAGRAMVRPLLRGSWRPGEKEPLYDDASPTVHQWGAHHSIEWQPLAGPAASLERPVTATTTLGVQSPPGRRWRWRLAGVAAVSVSALVLYQILVARSAPLATFRPPAGRVSGNNSAAAAASISIRLAAVPPQARLYLDGSALPANPFVGSLTTSRAQHRLRVEAADYEPLEYKLDGRNPISLEVHLSPMPSAISSRSPEVHKNRKVNPPYF